MASRTRPTSTTPPATDASAVPVVGAREPCPCGSGRRYKACHGRAAARPAEPVVHRPYAGLRGECDWVALREVVPAATAPLRLAAPFAAAAAERSVTLATVLPMAWPAVVRADSSVLLGLQSPRVAGDPSREAGGALRMALESEPGPVVDAPAEGDAPRLQDLLDPESPLVVTVHPGFDFWLEGVDDVDAETSASLERANAAVVPTARLVSVEAAYWAQLRDRPSLRWVLPHDEEPLLDAMARLHAVGGDLLGTGSRFIGSFRAHGLLVPVWDLAPATLADDVEDAAVAYAGRLGEALAEDRPLTSEERRARAGLAGRQITLRQ